MTEPDFSDLAAQHTLGDDPVPEPVAERAHGGPVELAWRNDLGGLTFRIDDEFVKWNPRRTGIDLELERARLDWIAGRHPAPRVIGWGQDDDAQWLVTSALPGESAVGDTWRARRPEAIRAIATGLRATRDRGRRGADPLLPRPLAPRVLTGHVLAGLSLAASRCARSRNA